MTNSSAPGRPPHNDPLAQEPAARATATNYYYALTYATRAAGLGLPPALQASFVKTEEVADEEWVCFYLNPPPRVSATEPLCVLKVRASDLTGFRKHDSLREALADSRAPMT
jgi:hypothetical protein